LIGQTNTPYTGQSEQSLIIKGGYLIRTANIQGEFVALTGDVNETTTIQVIAGAPIPLYGLLFNGHNLNFTQDTNGIVTATIPYTQPVVTVPDLSSQTWYYIDSLPELHRGYSDALWLAADYNTTDNTSRNITTPTSLYSSEYGYHTGTLLYRGRFRANGQEKTIFLRAQGGSAFGFSIWLNDRFLGSFDGIDAAASGEKTFNLPKLMANGTYVLTVVIDNMGLDENWVVGRDDMKAPRGILDYELDSHLPSDVTWRLTGNFGGENYVDKTRGPLNEGGMWAERQGFHLPGISTDGAWKQSKGPTEGITKPGIAWYTTSFDLNMPQGYDIPLSVVFANNTGSSPAPATTTPYRLQLYVNGWQFGKYINHIGPQTRFPVPEGIWNYQGKNWVAISLWAMEEGGAKVEGVNLVAGPIIQTGYGPVAKVESPSWSPRSGAY